MSTPLPDRPSADALRQLPSVDQLLRQPAFARLLESHARGEVVQAIRAVLEARRTALLGGAAVDCDPRTIALDTRQMLGLRSRPSLRRVINATGIVLHTGLGRAPLAEAAVEALTDVAAGYCNLEYDLDDGQRGDRHTHVRALLCELTGAGDALVVNNNAAGTLLALHALAGGRAVVVSRGQLVEIGGSYRMPDVMAAAGCRLVEVGTTNRTYARDYQRAIGAETAALLRVHTSNYRLVGFVHHTPLRELVEVARAQAPQDILVIDDLGSGLLEQPTWDAATGPAYDAGSTPGAWDEPAVRDSLAAGADVVLFSGDKLLGGPQAGIAVGRPECIARMLADPLARALRPDKLTLAALEATLRLYRDPATLAQRLPVRRMLAAPVEELEARAATLAAGLAEVPGATVTVAADTSYAGGGTLPTWPLPTRVVRLTCSELDSAALAAALRAAETPVVCRLHGAALVFDTRTLSDDDAAAIPAIVGECARELAR